MKDYITITRKAIAKLCVLFVLLSLFVFANSASAQIGNDNSWKGIEPLVTKKVEVRKILGKPAREGETYEIYKFEDENITITYGSAKPAPGAKCRWDISDDTVISIIVGFKRQVKLSQFGIDLSTYYSHEDVSVPGDFSYSNRDKGIYIATRLEEGVEKILGIEFRPTSKDKKEKCVPYLRKCKKL